MEKQEVIKLSKRSKTLSKTFYNDEILYADKSTNTIYLKEGVKRTYKRTDKDFLDLWFSIESNHVNEEALFYDKLLKAKKVIEDDNYWINDELS